MLKSRTAIWTIMGLIFLSLSIFNSCGKENMEAENKRLTEGKMKLNEADSVFNSGNYEGSRSLYEEAVKLAEADTNHSDLAEAYSMIARCYLITDKKEEGRHWIDKAGAVASEEQPEGWSRYLGVRGRFQWQDKEMGAATETFKDMYEYCSRHKLHSRAIDAAHMVAITGTPEQQVEWGLKGIKQAEKGDLGGWLGPLWNNLGWTYEDQKQYDKCLEAYTKAREYHYKHGTDRNKAVADWAVGHAHRLLGNTTEAVKWLNPLVPKFEEMNDGEFIGLTHLELGMIELQRENYKPALNHFQIAEQRLKEAGMPDWDPDGYNEILENMKSAREKAE